MAPCISAEWPGKLQKNTYGPPVLILLTGKLTDVVSPPPINLARDDARVIGLDVAVAQMSDALIMLGIVLLVNQLEGNVLHPLLTGGVVKVHPIGVVLGVIAGASVGVVAGAFLAVPAPATAMIKAAADYHSGMIDREPPANDGKASP